jgi:hypothetical protein
MFPPYVHRARLGLLRSDLVQYAIVVFLFFVAS